MSRLASACARWIYDARWPICIFIAALAVRLHWNLVLHPPGEYIYSDMRGYAVRAAGIFVDPWKTHEYSAFYPYGTHVLVYALQVVFGRGDFTGVAYGFAVLGAGIAALGHQLAVRVTRTAWVPPLVGLILIFHYPLISLGGYVLSEVPFCFCLTAATLSLVRLVDHGYKRDAWAAGLFVAVGLTLRPQILLSVAFAGVYWIVFRRHLGKMRLGLLIQAMVPVIAILGVSAWRLHYHTGRHGLISENGKFNQVFGRCHNSKIVALPDNRQRRRTSFGPPSLIQLRKRAKRHPGTWPQLDPARGVKFEYRGYIGDDAILGEFIRKCVAKTGPLKQVEYSLVNVMLLWRYNIMWPDSGKRAWQPYARLWSRIYANSIAVPSLACLLAVFFVRRRPKLALVSLHLWALIAIAAAYLGGVRFRAPYDAVLIVMGVEACAIGVTLVIAGWRRFARNRGNKAAVQAVGR